jgi:predicted dinucleotide-binding enzyme
MRTDDAASAGQQHPAQLDIGVVGAGRVGIALAVALSRAGHRVTAASAVSADGSIDTCRARQ